MTTATNDAILVCAEKTRKAICEAGDMLFALNGRAVRRLLKYSESDAHALAELNAHINVIMAMLARFDRETVPALEKALSQDS